MAEAIATRRKPPTCQQAGGTLRRFFADRVREFLPMARTIQQHAVNVENRTLTAITPERQRNDAGAAGTWLSAGSGWEAERPL